MITFKALNRKSIHPLNIVKIKKDLVNDQIIVLPEFQKKK